MVWIVVASSLITILISSAQLYQGFKESLSLLDKDLDEIQESIVPSITRSVWLMDQEQIEVGMKGLLLYDKIVYVHIKAEDGSAYHKD